MLSHLLNGLSAVGNVLDLPGSSVRDVLAGQNPFDQYLTPMSDTNRTTGRGLLRQYGMAGNEDTWGNWAGGMAAEMALDPTNLIGGGFLRKAFKGLGATKKLNAGIDAANALSQQQRAMGFMPEEIAGLTKIVDPQTGMPQRMYHGTRELFDQFDPQKSARGNNFGHGFYHTTDTSQADMYATGPTANVRMAHMDIRNPLNISGSYTAENLPPMAVEELTKKGKGVGTMTGLAVYKRFADRLPELGYDGLTQDMLGGHKLAVAWKPEQVYKPYIAKRLQDRKPLPTAHKTILRSMIAHNALARGGHK